MKMETDYLGLNPFTTVTLWKEVTEEQMCEDTDRLSWTRSLHHSNIMGRSDKGANV